AVDEPASCERAAVEIDDALVPAALGKQIQRAGGQRAAAFDIDRCGGVVVCRVEAEPDGTPGRRGERGLVLDSQRRAAAGRSAPEEMRGGGRRRVEDVGARQQERAFL